MSELNHVSVGINKAMKTLKKMTKKEANVRGYCKVSCGLFCRDLKECRADLFCKINANGYLVSEKSEFCSLTDKNIQTMQKEYNYNPVTKKITK